MVNLNFTPVFNATSDIVHVNTSYILANQPGSMTTPMVWVFCIALGIGCVLLSCITREDACNDLSGILGSIFLFISTIQAFAVDTVTGTGMASQCLVTTSGLCSQAEWVLLENHTIYHYDWIAIILGVIFLISLANLYRLWTDYRRVIGTPKNMGSVANAPQGYDLQQGNVKQTRDDNDPNSEQGYGRNRDNFRK